MVTLLPREESCHSDAVLETADNDIEGRGGDIWPMHVPVRALSTGSQARLQHCLLNKWSKLHCKLQVSLDLNFTLCIELLPDGRIRIGDVGK